MTEVLAEKDIDALSSSTRRNIVKSLRERPYTASELAKKLDKHVTTVGEHLNKLEKSKLVAKKDSDNKWVYYRLTDRGHKIFKPNMYSWVIILSLSTICVLTGIYELIFPFVGSSKEMLAMEAVENVRTAIPEINIIGIILLALGMIGFIYFFWKSK